MLTFYIKYEVEKDDQFEFGYPLSIFFTLFLHTFTNNSCVLLTLPSLLRTTYLRTYQNVVNEVFIEDSFSASRIQRTAETWKST